MKIKQAPNKNRKPSKRSKLDVEVRKKEKPSKLQKK